MIFDPGRDNFASAHEPPTRCTGLVDLKLIISLRKQRECCVRGTARRYISHIFFAEIVGRGFETKPAYSYLAANFKLTLVTRELAAVSI